MTVQEVLQAAADLARRAASEATSWDARLLLAHAIGRGPLALDPREDVHPRAGSRFEDLWARRLSGVPVQHLLGEWDFSGRPFLVDGRALIPRPETEALLVAALREALSARRLLDAGTGSGILAITFLLERPESQGVALDVSLEALALARENAARHGLGGRLQLVCSDWVAAIGPGRFDLALSNPPYLSLSEASSLPVTVRQHDPARALYAGEDALSEIRGLLDELPRVLAPGAPFLFEIGFGQAQAVEREIRSRRAWRFERIEPDLAGIPRVAIARKNL